MMLLAKGTLPLRRHAHLVAPCSSAQRAVTPLRGICSRQPIRPMAQSAAALQLQDSNGSQQDQGKAGPAARLASIGRDLAASCAGVALATAVVQLVASYVGKARDAFANQLRSLPGVEKAMAWQPQPQQLRSGLKLAAAVLLPLARVFAAESLTSVYARTFERAAFGFAKMYLFCLFMRVLLSWFPSIDWNSQPWSFLRLITEPYLQIYRGILPPLFGQLDFTPLFGFLILQDVVELMSPVYTLGHAKDTSMFWTTTDVMCYFDGH